MIVYALLLYIGVKIFAPWWYYALLFLGATIKTGAAMIRAAVNSQ